MLLVRQEDLEHSSGQFYMVRPGGPLERHVSDLISLSKTDSVADEVGRVVRVLPPALRDNVRSYLLDLFSRGRPLYRFNKEATENDIQARQAAIQADPPKEHYEQGKVLVRASSQPPEGEGIDRPQSGRPEPADGRAPGVPGRPAARPALGTAGCESAAGRWRCCC